MSSGGVDVPGGEEVTNLSVDDSICSVRTLSNSLCDTHASALSWIQTAGVPLAVACLPCGWGGEPEQERLRQALLSYRTRARFNAAMISESLHAQKSAAHLATERFLMRCVVDDLLRTQLQFPIERESESHTPYLRYTRLGGPKIGLRGRILSRLREGGLGLRNLHISFTHDGGTHLAAAAGSLGLRGLGIDVVHLPRLRKQHKDVRYLLRLVQGFMSEDECEIFARSTNGMNAECAAVQFAAHFSLMEAASKALGTGLMIGGGMGKPESLPKRSIEVLNLEPNVTYRLAPVAEERCRALKATRLEGHWGADEEFLVSVALLW